MSAFPVISAAESCSVCFLIFQHTFLCNICRFFCTHIVKCILNHGRYNFFCFSFLYCCRLAFINFSVLLLPGMVFPHASIRYKSLLCEIQPPLQYL